jgi:hypothetical protein
MTACGPAFAQRGETMLAPIPSLAALQANDDAPLDAELRLARLRKQAAIVRALADHVEHLSCPGDADGLGSQLVEEVARLGCRLLEAAGSLVATLSVDDSGVFARGPSPLRSST